MPKTKGTRMLLVGLFFILLPELAITHHILRGEQTTMNAPEVNFAVFAVH